MVIRTIAGILLVPIMTGFLLLPDTYMRAWFLVLSFVAMGEFYSAVLKGKKMLHLLGYLTAAGYVIFTNHFAIVLTISLIVMLLITVFRHERININDVSLAYFGFFYACFLLSFILRVRNISPGGEFFVWVIFIAAWGSDTGAYLAGKLFGRHKLTPKLSPNKTIEGAIGGVVFAVLIAVVYNFIVREFFNQQIFVITLIMVVCGAVVSQFGDLTASAIKRFAKIKDYGSIIPGHGGILDRFDSIILAAPVIYLILLMFESGWLWFV